MDLSEATPDDDRYELFVRLLTQHEASLRRFVRVLMSAWSDVDEIMQRTALAAWRKFATFDPDTDFLKWAMVVARFECLAYRRAMSRDRLVFSESFMELMEREAAEEETLACREARALEACLNKLPPDRREWVMRAYEDGVDQRDLAAALGKSSAAFYMLLSRIRKELAQCIQRTLSMEATS